MAKAVAKERFFDFATCGRVCGLFESCCECRPYAVGADWLRRRPGHGPIEGEIANTSSMGTSITDRNSISPARKPENSNEWDVRGKGGQKRIWHDTHLTSSV
jgi:hypothetical protein